MRFFTFHYMTYQGLDAEKAIEDYGVGWCTLPNSECDPRSWPRTIETMWIRPPWRTRWVLTVLR